MEKQTCSCNSTTENSKKHGNRTTAAFKTVKQIRARNTRPASVEQTKSACCNGNTDTVNCCQNKKGESIAANCCNEVKIPPEDSADGGCGCAKAETGNIPVKWIIGHVDTPVGSVPMVATKLAFSDVLGSWKARWSIGRMDYKVDPGLYCVGNVNAQSPVLVTANYKMTFDRLRMELIGLDAWILVLDTRGINVWCAAGKGTFGTDELVNRIAVSCLARVVTHRSLILPQLGAPGIAAHEVKKRSGFSVTYGPVRASDIKAFIAAGMTATEEMRTIRFTAFDRLVLTPMELIGSVKYAIIVFGALFLLNAINLGSYGWVELYALVGAILAGCVVTPVLLPWIPGRAFSFKGFLVGLVWACAVNLINGFPLPDYGWLKAAAFMLILPSLAAYGAMNFTGSSTYTSSSGVNSEMKIALPLMLVATAIGVVLLLVNDFIKLLG